ncbi:MAG: hypothetical protein JWO88_3073 [Frankiales bacterium]|nr:hypothetical protein [Frankiales bacterium]
MSVTRKLLAATAASTVSLLMAAVPAASAADPVAGGFADARGIVVNLSVLTQIPVPGPFSGSPIDPNTFANSSQSCLPNAGAPAPANLLNVNQTSPVVTATAVDTLASSKCNAADAVASAAAQTAGLAALVNAGVPTISADLIRAQANSDCTTAPNAKGSVFHNVVIAGQAIPDALALNEPNRVIPLPQIGVVILNEQHPTADGRGIVVNGLHLIGTGPLVRGDLIISHAVSGVVCPNLPKQVKDCVAPPCSPSDFTAVPGAKPEIVFDKDANPSTAKAGDTVTYTSTVRNVSASGCDVLTFFDHLDPAFDVVSTDGAFGKVFTTPAPKRSDGGTDVVLQPTGLTIAAGKSVTQTFVVKLKGTVKPGTYYNNLELFCAVNGDFASGPLAPVTVPAPAPLAAPAQAPAAAPEQLPRTGGSPLVAVSGLLLLIGAAGVRRALTR